MGSGAWRGAVLGLVLSAACGGGGPGASGGPDATPEDFLGRWTFTGGTVRDDCGGSGTFERSLVGQSITIERGTEADLMVRGTACTWGLRLEGARAVLAATERCTGSDAQGNPFTVELRAYSLQLAADRASLTERSASTVSGGGATCTRTTEGRLARPPP